MLVALDGYGLEDGSRGRGIGTYIRHLLDELSARNDLELSLIGGLVADAPPGVGRIAVGGVMPTRWQAAERRWRLGSAISRSGAALFHSTGQVPPRRSPIRWVQTLHDVNPLYFHHDLLAGEAKRWQALGHVVRAATAVITPSRSAADQGVRYLDLDPRRIHVIPHGVDPRFTPEGPATERSRPYLLWVSTWGPHKGLELAIEALAALRAAGYDHQLVAAGHFEPFARQLVERLLADRGLTDAVDLVGRVDDLGPLYRGATALVVSSRAEGFGFPALEAMACGTPVVSFDNTSLPEVVGDVGMLVADGDVTALSRALKDLIDDPAAAREMSRAGLRRAAQHTWARAADAHVAVYREAGLAS